MDRTEITLNAYVHFYLIGVAFFIFLETTFVKILIKNMFVI